MEEHNIHGWTIAALLREMGWVGGTRIRGMHVDIFEISDMQWSKQHAGLQAPQIQIRYGSREMGFAMMLLTITCGYLSSQCLVREQKLWKLCHMTLQAHAQSSGACCGSRHQQVSAMDFQTMV